MAKITTLPQFLNTLTENQIQELLNNFYGNDYLNNLVTTADDAEDAIDELIQYIISTYQSIDVIDGDTGEILDTIELNGTRNYLISTTRG